MRITCECGVVNTVEVVRHPDTFRCGACGRVHEIEASDPPDTVVVHTTADTETIDTTPQEEMEFVYDAGKHHVEHRGRGRWWVMEREEKVHGPLTKAEAKAYEQT